MFRNTGYNILSAGDAREGFRLTRHVSPDLIVSEMNLAGLSALEFCRMIRADKMLWATPLIFVSESSLSSETIIEMLDAGADECLCEYFNPYQLAAKAAWLIKQKHSENCLTQNYEIMRGRQMNIAQIIKGTAGLLTSSALEFQNFYTKESGSTEFNKSISQKIDLGMSLISALTVLLEEQANTLETWKRKRQRGEINFESKSNEETSEQSEINCKGIIYDLIDGDSPA